MTITTILFDCDNTLVLSEPLAFAACADLSNSILSQYAPSVTHRYTGPELQTQFVGRNFRGLISALEEVHHFKVPEEDIQSWVDKELSTTVEKIKEGCEPCEGVIQVLEKLSKEGKYKLAVVSSSALPRVIASLEKTNMMKYFTSTSNSTSNSDSNSSSNSEGQRVYSAASMNPPTSKPDPAVYLHACEELKVKPEECVAVEDSKSGATAAKNAGIPLMGYVGPYYDEGQEEVDRMVKVLKEDVGAKVVMHHWRDFEKCLEEMQN